MSVLVLATKQLQRAGRLDQHAAPWMLSCTPLSLPCSVLPGMETGAPRTRLIAPHAWQRCSAACPTWPGSGWCLLTRAPSLRAGVKADDALSCACSTKQV